jgi:phage-related protein
VVAFFAGAILGVVAAFKAYNAVMAIVRIVTTIAAGAQMLLNIALTANPIGIVVVAIAALIAGLTAAYFASEDFRKIVDQVFAVLGQVAGVIVGALGQAFTFLSEVLGTVMTFLKPIADIIGTVLVGAFTILGNIIGFVADLFGKFIQGIMDSPLFKIAGAIGDIVGGIGGFVGGLFGGDKPVPVAATSGGGGSRSYLPAPQVTTYVTLDGKAVAQSVDTRLGRTTSAGNNNRGR